MKPKEYVFVELTEARGLNAGPISGGARGVTVVEVKSACGSNFSTSHRYFCSRLYQWPRGRRIWPRTTTQHPAKSQYFPSWDRRDSRTS